MLESLLKSDHCVWRKQFTVDMRCLIVTLLFRILLFRNGSNMVVRADVDSM